MNKIRDLLEGYKQAVDSGTCSCSGRLFTKNCDILQEILNVYPSVAISAGACYSMSFLKECV